MKARVAFASIFVVAGVGHIAATGFFARIVPPWLPYPHALVLASGAAEMLLGVLLLMPKTRRFAAWGLIALLIAVFPANIYMYQNSDMFGLPRLVLLLRLPIQGALIAWAYRYTKIIAGSDVRSTVA